MVHKSADWVKFRHGGRPDERNIATLPSLFEAQAAACSGATALIFQDQKLSYRELDERANRLAHLLISRGVGGDVLVALVLDRSIEMIVALLAILKAGGAYLPLDPKSPIDRIRFMIADSGAALVVSTSRMAARLGPTAAILPIDTFDHDADQAGCPCSAPTDAHRSTPLDPLHLAYVIYTSGSTGRPKGVGISHGALARFLDIMVRRLEMRESDVVLALTTIAFDIAAIEIHLPLICGASVALLDDATTRDPALIRSEAVRLAATVIQTTPTRWAALLEAGVSGVRPWVGGEALPRTLAAGLLRVGPAVNLYGPTETTVWSTTWTLSEIDAGSGPTAPIGTPIADTQIHILDADLRPVAPGETGELYIGGFGLARGYVNRAGLTAERFIASPFGPPGGRIYRTGDLAKWPPGGSLEFLGRADQQVKIRGFRIEPGEIEAVLLSTPGVKQAVVVPREVAQETRLVAYFVPQDDTTPPTLGELRSRLSLQLPDYMIPAAFVALDAFPLLVSGKLDRSALPSPEFAASAGYIAPTDEVERLLCELFQGLTGAARVGIHDSFFDVGGHSLLGVKLMAEIEKAKGRRLPLSALFHAPTVAELAQLLETDRPAPEWRSLIPIELGGAGTPIFMIHWIERDLARHLAKDRPVWGLSVGLARRFDEADGVKLPETVEEVATHYIAELRSARPEGPYLLIGHSAGGVVAFEMARQLYAEGASVGYLGLLDADFPRPASERKPLSASRQLWNVITAPPAFTLGFAWMAIRNRLAGTFGEGRDEWGGSSMSAGYRARFITRSLNSYRPSPYPGRIHFLKSTIPPRYLRTAPPPPPERDWERMALGGFEVHVIEGDHMEIVKEPEVALTAEIILATIPG